MYFAASSAVRYGVFTSFPRTYSSTAAVDQGSTDAAKLLATLYIQGDGVKEDLATAKGYAGRVQQGRRDKADLDWLVWFTGKELRFGR